MSSISSARSIRTSGGSPLCRMMRFSVMLRRTPKQAARSSGISVRLTARVLGVDMRLLAVIEAH
jgi:hypothetical protein